MYIYIYVYTCNQLQQAIELSVTWRSNVLSSMLSCDTILMLATTPACIMLHVPRDSMLRMMDANGIYRGMHHSGKMLHAARRSDGSQLD